ncbi:MAG: insulinase family protein, partial [Planctomycetales bacterium]|nr:insulinase family protein [Planctomycetales bacterium]
KAGRAALAGEPLREGTGTRTALQISEAIEGVGGEFDTSPTGITARVRTPHLDLALDLAADVFQNATIPEEAFARKRDEQLSNIRSEMDEPRTIAQRAMQALAYGDHPYANPPLGTLESVEALTREDVTGYVRKFLVPGNAVLAVAGDVDAEDVRKRVEARFSGWAGDPPEADAIPEPAPQAEPRQRFVARPQDEQLNIYLGRVGVRRTNPDWYALLVMDYVLGTGPGFTDRLSKTLRDELGLAYTVGSRIAENAGIEPGLFSAYIGTSPVNKLKAIYGIRFEIARIRDELVSDSELAGAKAYLTGSFVFQLQTRAQLAEHLVAAERYGLGDDYIRRYPLLVNAVTAEDVRRVARTYLDPENATLTIVGRVDGEGFTTPPPPEEKEK